MSKYSEKKERQRLQALKDESKPTELEVVVEPLKKKPPIKQKTKQQKAEEKEIASRKKCHRHLGQYATSVAKARAEMIAFRMMCRIYKDANEGTIKNETEAVEGLVNHTISLMNRIMDRLSKDLGAKTQKNRGEEENGSIPQRVQDIHG